MTAAELAEKLGVSLRTYYGWESGYREMSMDYIPAVAEILGVKARTLMPEK